MKCFVTLICCLCLSLAPGIVLAKKGGNSHDKAKGPNPSESAYEHASDNAKFNRGEDWQGGKVQSVDDYVDEGLEGEEKGGGKKAKGKGKKGKKSKEKVGEPSEETMRKGKETHKRERVEEQMATPEEGEKRSKGMEIIRERILHQKNQD